jgi:hypothetical protein
MADTQIESGKKRDAQAALERQVIQLKRDVSRINKMLADRAEEVAEEASGFYDGASERASRAAQVLRSQAHSVSEAVKDNPGTVSTAMVLGAVIGFVLGMTLGQVSDNKHHRWF